MAYRQTCNCRISTTRSSSQLQGHQKVIQEEKVKKTAKLPKVTDFFRISETPLTLNSVLVNQELPTYSTSSNISLSSASASSEEKSVQNLEKMQLPEIKKNFVELTKLTDVFPISKTPLTSNYVLVSQEQPTCSTSSNISLSSESVSNEEKSVHKSEKIQLPETNESVVFHSQEMRIEQDPALWPTTFSDCMRQAYLNRGSGYFQNNDGKFEASIRKCQKQNRSLSVKLFESRQSNGESYVRKLLMYSKSNGSVYCFICKLFCTDQKKIFVTGFSDWKKAEEKVKSHENSLEHRKNLLTWKTHSTSSKIDEEITKSMDKEIEYWKNVFKRIVEVIKFIAERGLAFRGEDERLGSSHNGNYLGILELISKFDPFLYQHLENFGQKGKGRVSYISKTIYEEIIRCMGKQIYNTIITEIKEAKYYSIIVDSTPDLSHVDQLSVVFRYCLNGKVIERFLCFVPIHSHTGKSLANEILSLLRTNSVKIENCRGQSYDNASNMSGKYNGVQAEIKKMNKLARYVPCAAHSLNLVGESSVDECVEASNFFGFLKKLYAFFGASTHRWEILIKNIKKQNEENGEHRNVLVVKSLSATRWSCREQAVKSLVSNYDGIFNALKQLAENPLEKKDTKDDAFFLKKKMISLENAFMATFWNELLERFDTTSKYLQKPGLDVITGHKMLVSLLEFVCNLRGQFESLEKKAKAMSSILNTLYKDEYQRNVIKKLADGSTETTRQGQDKFRIESYLPMIDKITSELKKRSQAYKEVSDMFGFFGHLTTLSSNEITDKALNVIGLYSDDLDKNLVPELLQFSEYLKTLNGKNIISVPFLLDLLIEKDLLELILTFLSYLKQYKSSLIQYNTKYEKNANFLSDKT
ncbi:unnamed protein product [Brassicogethes aeneus]|uniref:DUF4371 domain-containing protein n=1 Tax=Brassicogethes aeneus TaxID=1431903 RepID=A0A9P0BIU9_BRAAE|nr:unnamed protein product [Brassicogethes aeneus]